MRRRSAPAWSTARLRASASCRTRASSCPRLAPSRLRATRPCVAPSAWVISAETGTSTRPTAAASSAGPGPCTTNSASSPTVTSSARPSGRVEYQSGSVSRPIAVVQQRDDDRRPQRGQREQQQQVGQVLPRRAVVDDRLPATPARGVGQRPVGIGDLGAERRGDPAALDPRAPAPGHDRGPDEGDADPQDGQRDAGHQAGHDHAEPRQPDHEARQQVEQREPRARLHRRPQDGGEGTSKGGAGRHRPRIGRRPSAPLVGSRETHGAGTPRG